MVLIVKFSIGLVSFRSLFIHIDQIMVVLQLVQNNRKSALSPSPVDFRSVLKHSQAEVVRASVNHSITKLKAVSPRWHTKVPFHDLPFIFSYYNKQWSEAQAALTDLLQQEIPPEPPKPEKVNNFVESMNGVKMEDCFLIKGHVFWFIMSELGVTLCI